MFRRLHVWHPLEKYLRPHHGVLKPFFSEKAKAWCYTRSAKGWFNTRASQRNPVEPHFWVKTFKEHFPLKGHFSTSHRNPVTVNQPALVQGKGPS